jgi:hypothetical protein
MFKFSFLIIASTCLLSAQTSPGALSGTSFDSLNRPVTDEVVDLSLHRMFEIRESNRLEFRPESFNLLKHRNIGVPGPYPDFDQYFGKILSTGQPRRYQVALRFGF